MGLFDKLNAKFELFKLEQKYTKRKRRTTFISDAVYVDGEYVYQDSYKSIPTSSKSNMRSSTNARRSSNHS